MFVFVYLYWAIAEGRGNDSSNSAHVCPFGPRLLIKIHREISRAAKVAMGSWMTKFVGAPVSFKCNLWWSFGVSVRRNSSRVGRRETWFHTLGTDSVQSGQQRSPQITLNNWHYYLQLWKINSLPTSFLYNLFFFLFQGCSSLEVENWLRSHMQHDILLSSKCSSHEGMLRWRLHVIITTCAHTARLSRTAHALSTCHGECASNLLL